MRAQSKRHALMRRTSEPGDRRKAALAVALGSVLVLGGCNMMEGLGEDVQSAGQGLEEEADELNE